MPERESDLTSLAEIMGAHRMRHGWPPETLAPGITMTSRRHQKRDDKTQEPAGHEVYLAPMVDDSRLYYAHLSLRNYREEDENNCRVCNGAGAVRRGELVPGQPGFGMPMRCPRWQADTHRCEPTARRDRYDHMGLES